MAKKITLQAPVINVTPDNVSIDNTGEDINDIIMSSGTDQTGDVLPTAEHDVNDLILNSQPYVEPETATLGGEWWKRTKDIAKQVGRYGELAIRGATPTLASTTAGFALGGPVGAAVGTVALPFGDLINSTLNRTVGTNLGMPSEIASRYLTPGIRPPETESERMAQAAGSSVGGVASELGAAFNLAKTAQSPVTRGVAQALSERPKLQLATSAPIGAATQYIYDETGNPILPMVAGMGAGALTGLRTTKRATQTISHEELMSESQNLFNKAKESGITFNKDNFGSAAKSFGTDLRGEGYTPNAYPKVASALEEMQNPTTPKDFTELSAIRKMIQNAQASADPSERRIASILKDKFDDYVLNAPKEHISAGDKGGLEAWKDARSSYNKLKKAEIFDDMLSNAELDKSKFTASGAENSLATQLRNLAKNDKKMRLFTTEEQNAIIEAAKGGSTQNMLKFFGRFAPTGVVGGIFTGGLLTNLPVVGPLISGGTVLSRKLATGQRAQDVQNLADMMRLGKKPELESRLRDVPTQTVRGALSSQQQKENKTKLTDLIPK
tara:strand:+ start:1496 stop:3160 length:1665 start_codon:yes stop_codon:yes gene_type:complete